MEIKSQTGLPSSIAFIVVVVVHKKFALTGQNYGMTMIKWTLTYFSFVDENWYLLITEWNNSRSFTRL